MHFTFVQAFVPIKNSDRRAFARGAPAHHIHGSLERIGMYVRVAFFPLKKIGYVLIKYSSTHTGRFKKHKLRTCWMCWR